MKDGQLVTQNPTDQVVDDPQPDYTRELILEAREEGSEP